MKKKFSIAWKSSKKPRKQRKYIVNAPLHIKRKLLSSHLSKPLRKEYKTRSIKIRKGDTVKIMRGEYKKRTGKITKVDIKRQRVYIEGIEITKKDGTKRLQPINPSNLLIEALQTDKRRLKKFKNV